MNEVNNNKEFISSTLIDTLNNMQIKLSQQIGDLAVLGFISNSNTYCILSIIALLNNAIDNPILFNKRQWDNILLLYNKISHAGNI